MPTRGKHSLGVEYSTRTVSSSVPTRPHDGRVELVEAALQRYRIIVRHDMSHTVCQRPAPTRTRTRGFAMMLGCRSRRAAPCSATIQNVSPMRPFPTGVYRGCARFYARSSPAARAPPHKRPAHEFDEFWIHQVGTERRRKAAFVSLLIASSPPSATAVLPPPPPDSKFSSTMFSTSCNGMHFGVTTTPREQRLRVDQVARVEAFGEPGVDRGEQVARFGALALIAPEAREARRGPQLKRARPLLAGDGEGTVIAGAAAPCWWCRRPVARSRSPSRR